MRLAVTALSVIAISAVLSCAAVFAQSVPQFRHYATGAIYSGPRLAPDLSSREAYNYRTRLRAEAPREPNFASDHRVVTWGCGTSCETGAVINLRNGRVTFFPFSVCCSAKDDEPGFNRIEFRPNSALIIFSGLRNEEGIDGAHFYEFSGRGFHFIYTKPFTPPASKATGEEEDASSENEFTPAGPVSLLKGPQSEFDSLLKQFFTCADAQINRLKDSPDSTEAILTTVMLACEDERRSAIQMGNRLWEVENKRRLSPAAKADLETAGEARLRELTTSRIVTTRSQ